MSETTRPESEISTIDFPAAIGGEKTFIQCVRHLSHNYLRSACCKAFAKAETLR